MRVRPRHVPVLRAAMPKAPVDEDNDALPRKYDVGLDAYVASPEEVVLAEPRSAPVQP